MIVDLLPCDPMIVVVLPPELLISLCLEDLSISKGSKPLFPGRIHTWISSTLVKSVVSSELLSLIRMLISHAHLAFFGF
jgi:hypothetical protein